LPVEGATTRGRGEENLPALGHRRAVSRPPPGGYTAHVPSRTELTGIRSQPGSENNAPPPDDPRGELATVASGRSERTPVAVFAWVAAAVGVLFLVALVVVVVAYVAA